jgi:hypothetical protein
MQEQNTYSRSKRQEEKKTRKDSLFIRVEQRDLQAVSKWLLENREDGELDASTIGFLRSVIAKPDPKHCTSVGKIAQRAVTKLGLTEREFWDEAEPYRAEPSRRERKRETVGYVDKLRLMQRITGDKHLSPNEMLVYQSLFRHANEGRGDVAWLSLNMIAADIARDRPSVCRSLKTLEAKVGFKIEHSNGGRNKRSEYHGVIASVVKRYDAGATVCDGETVAPGRDSLGNENCRTQGATRKDSYREKGDKLKKERNSPRAERGAADPSSFSSDPGKEGRELDSREYQQASRRAAVYGRGKPIEADFAWVEELKAKCRDAMHRHRHGHYDERTGDWQMPAYSFYQNGELVVPDDEDYADLLKAERINDDRVSGTVRYKRPSNWQQFWQQTYWSYGLAPDDVKAAVKRGDMNPAFDLGLMSEGTELEYAQVEAALGKFVERMEKEDERFPGPEAALRRLRGWMKHENV